MGRLIRQQSQFVVNKAVELVLGGIKRLLALEVRPLEGSVELLLVVEGHRLTDTQWGRSHATSSAIKR